MSAGVTLKGQPPAFAQYRTHPLPSASPSQTVLPTVWYTHQREEEVFETRLIHQVAKSGDRQLSPKKALPRIRFKDIMGWRRVIGSMSNQGSLYSSSQSESLENNLRWKSVASWHQKVTWVPVKSQRIQQKWEVAPAAFLSSHTPKGFPPARLAAQLGDIRSVYSYKHIVLSKGCHTWGIQDSSRLYKVLAALGELGLPPPETENSDAPEPQVWLMAVLSVS